MQIKNCKQIELKACKERYRYLALLLLLLLLLSHFSCVRLCVTP